MSKIKKMNFIYLILTCIVISVIAFVVFYSYIDKQLSYPKDEEIKLEDDIILEPNINDNASVEVATKAEDEIKAYTRLVYQYYYEEDGQVVENTTEPPYYLINKNRKQIEEYYPDWQLVSFSNKQVVLRKSIAITNNTKKFIIGAFENYICIYYGDGTIKEITQTNISSLPQEEQELIKKGIEVESEEELLKYLQDYTS